MRLWIVHQDAGTPYEYGYSRHFELAKSLIAQGWEVKIIASAFNHKAKEFRVDISEEYAVSQNVDGVECVFLRSTSYQKNNWKRVVNFCSFPYYLNRYVSRFIKVQKENLPDFVLASSPSLFSARAALSAAKRMRCPFVFEIRDLHPDTIIHLGKYSELHPAIRFMRLMEKHLYKNAAGAVSNLPFANERIVELGYPRQGPFIYIPNGVAYDSQNLLQSQSGSTEIKKEFVFVYAGSHGISNDLDKIIDAFNHVKLENLEQKKTLSLRLVGDGPLKAELKQKVKKLNLEEFVLFEDSIQQDEVRPMLQKADALILAVPSSNLYKYGIGANKIYEYMASGRPVFCISSARNDPITDVGSGVTISAEVSIEGVAQQLIEFSEMGNEKLKEMGRLGVVAVSENYTYGALGKELGVFLQTVIKSDMK
ncbi:glycosyltransferase family 4 protein [Hirschia maritima]|uniref:glycosyltransferase family 4 protein n=1 Tax=Hirschia maritima TaxID=1121961 RepID=UPI0003787845|nr:glycosyltransferase family 4 protein [Hirschia maritima]